MFLFFWQSEPQRSYKHGSYSKKGVYCKNMLLPICKEKEKNVRFSTTLGSAIAGFYCMLIIYVQKMSLILYFPSKNSTTQWTILCNKEASNSECIFLNHTYPELPYYART